MVNRFVKWLFLVTLGPDRSLMHVRDIANLAQAGTASWLLAQERARIDFVAAKDTCMRTGSWRAVPLVFQRFLDLQSTNAIVQSLLNEYHLERIVHETSLTDAEHEESFR